MMWFLKNKACPIGVAVDNDHVQLAQLSDNGQTAELIASGSKRRPDEIAPASVEWQKWAIDAMQKLMARSNFKGKKAAAMLPADEVYIEHIKKPDSKEGDLNTAVFSMIKEKLPFEAQEKDLLIKHIDTEDGNMIVLAAGRTKVDRHLAIYEQADVEIRTISIWPEVLTNCYVKFFGRRKADLQTRVMLIDIANDSTNVVICKHKKLLFAQTVPTGLNQIEGEEALPRLVSELKQCKSSFVSMYSQNNIERLIFLSGGDLSRDICASIAEQLRMPAQLGDCFAAVEISDSSELGLDRSGCRAGWAGAFGLSLQQ